ncbi:MAG: hypothetical protein ACYC61_12920 [Isosphaeraceae bacterium]
MLATIPDPFPKSAGPLSVALGDFTGSGYSQLAISARYSSKIWVWSFQQNLTPPYNSPLNATVTPVSMGASFVPAGLKAAHGLNLAAFDPTGHGVFDLIATPATKGPAKAVLLAYGSQSGWQLQQTLGKIPVNAGQGLSVAAGDVTGSGSLDLVFGSQATSRVAVYSEALGRWVGRYVPLGKKVQNLRVAVDSSEGTGATGSILVTGTARGSTRAAIVPWQGRVQSFQLAASPGAGALVPLDVGYVYRPSTIIIPSNPLLFAYSPGLATSSAIFVSSSGSQLVIQEFAPAGSVGSSAAGFVPSTPDTFVEPLWGNPGNGFIPLQPVKASEATGQTASNTSSLDPVPINLVVLPKNDDQSPFSINLSCVSASVTAGLEPITPLINSITDPWGPQAFVNTPPTVNSQTTVQSFQQRVIAAYASFLGVDDQHHYHPLWALDQQTPWNIATTVAYQSPGVDCPNYTASAYADALGILIRSATDKQSAVTSRSDIQLPKDPGGGGAAIDAWIPPQTFYPQPWGNTYQGLVNMLQPGDILFIKGSNGTVTHAITWLGSYGQDANGADKYLIIDATVITPEHVDSNNRIIPEGVRIRPFADGTGSQPNSWYFSSVDHVLRIIGNPPVG